MATSSSILNFNSIKVRLNPRSYITKYIDRLDFNSIKVRLNRSNTHQVRVNSIRFQFHKGTIKPDAYGVPNASAEISIP